jgi:hypothetical protein
MYVNCTLSKALPQIPWHWVFHKSLSGGPGECADDGPFCPARKTLFQGLPARYCFRAARKKNGLGIRRGSMVCKQVTCKAANFCLFFKIWPSHSKKPLALAARSPWEKNRVKVLRIRNVSNRICCMHTVRHSSSAFQERTISPTLFDSTSDGSYKKVHADFEIHLQEILCTKDSLLSKQPWLQTFGHELHS